MSKTGFYDQHPDFIPVRLFSSQWACAVCPGASWVTNTDYCRAATEHHNMTGHRVNGWVDMRYVAKHITEL
jgi:hypothetical protein